MKLSLLHKLTPSFIISFVVLCVSTFLIYLNTDGYFTYTLDDPYIHLKLAKNIAQGHYGLNLSEYSAPSSSIIWPFLLVPFVFFENIFEYTPLIFNIVFALLSVIILDNFFSYLSMIKRACVVIFIMFFCNLYGLVFTGLEHSLQLLLVIYITYNMVYIENIQKNTIKLLVFGAIFLLPLVRYEGLGLTVPVLVYFYTQGYKKEALICFISTIFAIVAFSLFLYWHDLGYLPTSILMKTLWSDNPKRMGLPFWKNRFYNFKDNIRELHWLYIISLGLFAYFLKRNKPLGFVILTSSLLHLFFGKYGWFGRYEVYQLTFVIMILLLVLSKESELFLYDALIKWIKLIKGFIYALKPQYQNGLYAALVLIALVFFQTKLSKNGAYDKIFQTPLASSNIYHQQGQMAKITQMLDDVVAINDIGLVSLKSKHEILDIYGLASMQVFKYKMKEPKNAQKWLKKIIKQKNISFVMLYSQWFEHLPQDWEKIAILKLNQPKITPAFDTVVLYATNAEASDKMVSVLHKYVKNYPSEYHKIEFITPKNHKRETVNAD